MEQATPFSCPELKKLYASITEAVHSRSRAFQDPEAALFSVGKNGKSQSHYDCHFFYQWVNGVPTVDRDDFLKQLQSFGIAKSTWQTKFRYNGSGNTNLIDKIFACSARYNNSTVEQHLAGYIKYADKAGASLYGIRGHEETVKAILAGKLPRRDHQIPPSHKVPGLHIFWENNVCKIEAGEGKKHLRRPNNYDSLNLEEVATLLDWRYHLTPFLYREQELLQLHKWLDAEPRKSISLIYGGGGTGKTRLAFQLAKESVEKGWQAGQPDKDIAGDWIVGNEGLLIIIDYPEERPRWVSQFVEAIKDSVISGELKIRLVLVSRNLEYLRTFTEEALGLEQCRIHLTGLETIDEQWELLNSTWNSLQQLQGNSPSPLEGATTAMTIYKKTVIATVGRVFSFPIKKHVFSTWSKQQGQPPSPLIIAATAIYLFENKEGNNSDLLNLKSQEIIRYLSVRESKCIRKEVEAYNDKLTNGEKIDYQSILLLKAMAAITDGLNNKQLQNLLKDLGQHNIDYNTLDKNHIKLMSIWESKQIQPIKPDILAADFLVYNLERWVEDQQPEWVFFATGLCRVNDPYVDHDRVLNNFFRLNRLMYDIVFSLELRRRLDALGDIIGTNYYYCDWLSNNIALHTIVPYYFKNFLIQALMKSASGTEEKLAKMQYFTRASSFLIDFSAYEPALLLINAVVRLSCDFLSKKAETPLSWGIYCYHGDQWARDGKLKTLTKHDLDTFSDVLSAFSDDLNLNTFSKYTSKNYQVLQRLEFLNSRFVLPENFSKLPIDEDTLKEVLNIFEEGLNIFEENLNTIEENLAYSNIIVTIENLLNFLGIELFPNLKIIQVFANNFLAALEDDIIAPEFIIPKKIKKDIVYVEYYLPSLVAIFEKYNNFLEAYSSYFNNYLDGIEKNHKNFLITGMIELIFLRVSLFTKRVQIVILMTLGSIYENFDFDKKDLPETTKLIDMEYDLTAVEIMSHIKFRSSLQTDLLSENVDACSELTIALINEARIINEHGKRKFSSELLKNPEKNLRNFSKNNYSHLNILQDMCLKEISSSHCIDAKIQKNKKTPRESINIYNQFTKEDKKYGYLFREIFYSYSYMTSDEEFNIYMDNFIGDFSSPELLVTSQRMMTRLKFYSISLEEQNRLDQRDKILRLHDKFNLLHRGNIFYFLERHWDKFGMDFEIHRRKYERKTGLDFDVSMILKELSHLNTSLLLIKEGLSSVFIDKNEYKGIDLRIEGVRIMQKKLLGINEDKSLKVLRFLL